MCVEISTPTTAYFHTLLKGGGCTEGTTVMLPLDLYETKAVLTRNRNTGQ